MPSVSSASLLLTALSSRSRVALITRTLPSAPRRTFASPPSPTEQEELNEAQKYLAAKAARKAERSSNPKSASARHASLYSQLFPALLRILAYGSTAYFGLHLLWNVLDRDEQTKLMNAQAGSLEATARDLTEKVENATQKAEVTAKQVAANAEQRVEEIKEGKKKWYWPF